VALVDEVELQGDVAGDLLDYGAEVQVALQQAEDAQEEADAIEVGVDDVPDAGVLDLDGDCASVLEDGAVDLGEGGGGYRLLVELGEDVGQGAAELEDDGALDGAEGAGRDLVLEAGEGVDVLVGDEVGSGAEDLAELDEQPLLVDGQAVELLGGPLVVGLTAGLGVLLGQIETALAHADHLVAGVDAPGEARHGEEAAEAVSGVHRHGSIMANRRGAVEA
jgi:hypothetical protein